MAYNIITHLAKTSAVSKLHIVHPESNRFTLCGLVLYDYKEAVLYSLNQKGLYIHNLCNNCLRAFDIDCFVNLDYVTNLIKLIACKEGWICSEYKDD